ncbi:hypothetical protein BU14_0371s0001 [Porphyra umbilicalis]|uniref:HIT domain-containing protein n=1 Tax=Porphyra umbilicalis TaxID=2786 RepID=A0A1X6NX61_PORUM|nr:hypothetical protein BU14_0371s0001 [Porphyra umbilicalis]|eukprot:OSX73167.1 hypothetical protein BU14_0371s0001 [Porphyra umbilicalis]
MASTYTFGRHAIAPSEVFLATPHVFAMVNWKPVRPGHVLVVTRRVAPRLADATAAEAADLFATARTVGVAMEAHAAAAGLSFVIQDGAAAGQTVPHVHVHLIPRVAGDFVPNDKVYDAVDGVDLSVLRGGDGGVAAPTGGGRRRRRRPTPPQAAKWTTRGGCSGRPRIWRPRRRSSARSLRTCLYRSRPAGGGGGWWHPTRWGVQVKEAGAARIDALAASR